MNIIGKPTNAKPNGFDVIVVHITRTWGNDESIVQAKAMLLLPMDKERGKGHSTVPFTAKLARECTERL